MRLEARELRTCGAHSGQRFVGRVRTRTAVRGASRLRDGDGATRCTGRPRAGACSLTRYRFRPARDRTAAERKTISRRTACSSGRDVVQFDYGGLSNRPLDAAGQHGQRLQPIAICLNRPGRASGESASTFLAPSERCETRQFEPTIGSLRGLCGKQLAGQNAAGGIVFCANRGRMPTLTNDLRPV
jgi:hypothetical protein